MPKATIPRRVRFEVLRRDNYTCRYCGASAPEVKLEVDHVIPEALGGKATPDNLVTACAPCNGGKASTSPSERVVQDVADDAQRWADAMRAASAQIREQRESDKALLEPFDRAWRRWRFAGEEVPRPSDWRDTVIEFLMAGVDLEVLIELVDVAMESQADVANTWRYFCGCAWKRFDEVQALAKKIVAGSPTSPSVMSAPKPPCRASEELCTALACDAMQKACDTVTEDLIRGWDLGVETGFASGVEYGLHEGAHRAARAAGQPSEPTSLSDILAPAVAD